MGFKAKDASRIKQLTSNKMIARAAGAELHGNSGEGSKIADFEIGNLAMPSSLTEWIEAQSMPAFELSSWFMGAM